MFGHWPNIFFMYMCFKAHSHSMRILSALEFALVESGSNAHSSRSYYILNFAGLLLYQVTYEV